MNSETLKEIISQGENSCVELMRLFQQSGVFHFDKTSVEGTTIRNLNLYKIASYFKTYLIDFDSISDTEKVVLLKNTDILTEDEKVSIAGMLIFGTIPQKYLPLAGISFAHFLGDNINSELIDKQNIDANIDYQVDTTTSIIKNNIMVSSDIIGNKRVDKGKIYPEKVFRELIVNAVCHRNYSIIGSKIRVFMFSDRLEVISPGRLPNTVTIEKLTSGVSYSVNPVIVKFMENLNYVDKLGRGLPMVYAEAKKLGKTVKFEEIGEEFKVSLEL
jgi:ATP-dependent DNA helicase RecG